MLLSVDELSTSGPRRHGTLVYFDHWTNHALLFHKSDQVLLFSKGERIVYAGKSSPERQCRKKCNSISGRFL